MLIELAVEKYLQDVPSDSTRETYERCLRQIIPILRVKDTTELDRDTFRRLLHYRNGKAAYKRLLVQVASKFLEYLEFEHLSTLSTADVRYMRKGSNKATAAPPSFPRDEIERLLEYAKEPKGNDLQALRLSAIILTLADSGFRVSELCALKRGDVDFREARTVIVGKGKKHRVVRFSTRGLRALRAYMDCRKDGETGKALHTIPLFTTLPRGKKPSTKALSVVSVRHLIGKASHGKVHPHHFRHRFVTLLVREHGQAVAQQIVGHERADTTARYTHLNNDELDKAYDETFNRH